MAVTEKTLIGHIDLTPSWRQQVEHCIAILEGSKNEIAKETARNELLRMADIVDNAKRERNSTR